MDSRFEEGGSGGRGDSGVVDVAMVPVFVFIAGILGTSCGVLAAITADAIVDSCWLLLRTVAWAAVLRRNGDVPLLARTNIESVGLFERNMAQRYSRVRYLE